MTSGGFLKWGYPQSSSILDWDFPWTKPAILGTPMTMETLKTIFNYVWMNHILIIINHGNPHFPANLRGIQLFSYKWVYIAQELGMNLHFSVRDAPCEKSRMLRPQTSRGGGLASETWSSWRLKPWLVVEPPLEKDLGQLGSLFPLCIYIYIFFCILYIHINIYMYTCISKIQNVPNHQPDPREL